MTTDQERLQLIIETALKHGWNGYTYDEMVIALTKMPATATTALLYGDNLSLLKAACGEDLSGTVVRSLSWHDISMKATKYQWVAQQSVLLPDNERLSFIAEHLRKDYHE